MGDVQQSSCFFSDSIWVPQRFLTFLKYFCAKHEGKNKLQTFSQEEWNGLELTYGTIVGVGGMR